MSPEMLTELLATADVQTWILVGAFALSEAIGANRKIRSNGIFSLVFSILKDGIKAQLTKGKYS